MSSPAQSRTRLLGVCPPARGAVLAGWIHARGAGPWLVVVPDLRTAESLAEDVVLFGRALGAELAWESLVLPESMPEGGDMRDAFGASSDRLAVLSRLLAPPPASGRLVILTTPAALAQPVPARADLKAHEFVLRRGASQAFAALVETLKALDYDSEALCESPGSYAVRGGIIDVYPVTADQPYRLDFFGDSIDDMRTLDPVTQRSGAQVDSITLTATPRVPMGRSTTGLADYLASGTRLVLVEPASMERAFSQLAEALQADPLAPVIARCTSFDSLSDLDEPDARLVDGTPELLWESESLVHSRSYPGENLLAQERLQFEEEARDRFLTQLGAWRKAGARLACVATREGEEKRIREILSAHPAMKSWKPVFLRGTASEGFRVAASPRASAADLAVPALPLLSPGAPALVVVTETEILGRQRPRRPSRRLRAVAQRHQVDQLLDFSELVEGDFVVHLQHGIALYRGLSRIETRDGQREVISLEFDDHVILHVPLQESHLVSRYVGLSKSRPQLGRIGSNRWEKARKAAELATIDLAAELLRIHAQREAQPGHAFPADSAWQKEFEAAFTFTETPDQMKAIVDAKSDMERERPMDRLICGDVGYGKTEVAIRAAFKAVQGGKQVAVLVPTTVLAQQHLNSFRERMAGYPIVIDMVSRFRSRSEQARILAAAGAGQVDILIGTHRLLQTDVVFKDLGLVIVDEEQRFGVRHKENLKRMRATVDFLSMSATPIPRTLYLALTGARDMSVIETPPTNRLPIQTIVKTYDEKIVVDAVRFEIARGGQVFYLHNRILTIGLVADRLRQLMPDLRVGIGHGQMEADELEQVMTDFVAGKFDVLVCTTIIESGLDIPNCNTLIIEGADRFGLSQLYQIRGRVGRFRHQAYAYLLLHRHTHLLDVARQRLAAIRQHSQLGAGFRIAMRDLELRGAGNLLGAEQSGHIVGVGFDLYCQLLRQSVARLKGEQPAARIRATVKLDFVFLGDGTPAPDRRDSSYEDAYTAVRDAELEAAGAVEVALIQARIPASYVSETRLRIDLYRRLALVESPDQLKQLQADLQDRFGKFGDEVKALLLVTEIRLRAEQKGISSVETDSNRLKLLRASGRRDDWVMLGTRFPRLTAPKPLLRLREIVTFLNNLT
ncbi:transcription-repair-coupling factor [mine drainage metagenome]|uniref:Transcription-repair-coupling factor n=1 Tax=mine drainage metagenome TaxID=410659 RepID=A0A1J5SYF4_9ZZZZ